MRVRRYLACLALLLVTAVAVWAATTLSQSSSTSTAAGGSPPQTGTVTASGSIAAGDLLIVGINFGSTTPTTYSPGTNYTVSDTNSLTWNACPVGPVIQGNSIGCFYAIDGAGHGSTTVTVSIANGGNHTLRLALYDYNSSTGWNASPVDTSNSNSSSSAGSSGNPGPVTPAATGELIWAAIQLGTAGATGITGTGGCTERPAGGGSGLGWVGGARADGADIQSSGNTSTTCGFSWSSVSSAYSALVVVFKPAPPPTVSIRHNINDD